MTYAKCGRGGAKYNQMVGHMPPVHAGTIEVRTKKNFIDVCEFSTPELAFARVCGVGLLYINTQNKPWRRQLQKSTRKLRSESS